MNEPIQNSEETPQAKFVKNIWRKDHPEKTEEELEAMWQERIATVIGDNEDGCLSCSG